MPSPLYTLADAAEATGIARQTIVDIVTRDGLGIATVGGTILLTQAHVDRLAALRKSVGRPKLANKAKRVH